MLRLQAALQTILLSAIGLCILAPAQQFSHSTPVTTSRQEAAVEPDPAFTPGFIRGYEHGFHAADLDFHVGRIDRKLDTLPEYRKASSGYSESFGDKEKFQEGYRLGFAQGYDDSFHSRHFSALVAGQAAKEVRSKKYEVRSKKWASEKPEGQQRVTSNAPAGLLSDTRSGTSEK